MQTNPMPQVLSELAKQLQSLTALCVGGDGAGLGDIGRLAESGGHSDSGGQGYVAGSVPAVQRDPEQVDPAQVVALVAAASKLSRLSDGLLIHLAGVVDSRTQRGRGVDVSQSLAHSQGYKTAHDLLRQVSGASGATVRQWLDLSSKLNGALEADGHGSGKAGAGVSGGAGGPGDESGHMVGGMPDRQRGLSHLRRAVQTGDIHVDAAKVLARKLTALPAEVPDEHIQAAELVLLSRATGKELIPGAFGPESQHSNGEESGSELAQLPKNLAGNPREDAGEVCACGLPSCLLCGAGASSLHGSGAEVLPGSGAALLHGLGGGVLSGSGAGSLSGSNTALPVHADDLHVLADGLLAQVRALNELPFQHDDSKPNPRKRIGMDAADRERFFQIGPTKGGLTYFSGATYPEIAAALGQILDSQTNPRVKSGQREAGRDASDGSEAGRRGDEAGDTRTMKQRRHDGFASFVRFVLDHPGRTHLGGQGVSLMLHISQEDYVRSQGTAFVQDAHGRHTPVDGFAARHIGCVGSVKKIITGPQGEVVQLESAQRVFPAALREAVVARDGGCVIPGCGIKASWCEVHHVQEWQHGGKTSLDNGVLLCWYHHRNLEKHGWSIAMSEGMPIIQAPKSIDPEQRWRPPQNVHRPPQLQAVLARIRKIQARLRRAEPQVA